MAKFQLCEFLRTKPTTKLKSETVWEKGVAKLNEEEDVEFIMDENGNKLPQPYNFRRCYGQGYTQIDTEALVEHYV